MKLLLDANVSWRLSEKLKFYYEDCVHVEKITLPVPAKDIDIWNYAAIHQMIIVTNDEDFLDFVRIKGFPPKVILMRTGNQSNDFILSLLLKYKPEIILLEETEQMGVLEIF